MLVPVQTPYVSGEVSVFEKLVSIGEEKILCELPRQLHDFLVQCLIEHLRDVEITQQTLALVYLAAREKGNSVGNLHLKNVGDGSLILDGFFPERAHRLNVEQEYFRAMGQMAYANLALRLFATGRTEPGKFYNSVARSFALLAKVLRASRASPEVSWGMRITGLSF